MAILEAEWLFLPPTPKARLQNQPQGTHRTQIGKNTSAHNFDSNCGWFGGRSRSATNGVLLVPYYIIHIDKFIHSIKLRIPKTHSPCVGSFWPNHRAISESTCHILNAVQFPCCPTPPTRSWSRCSLVTQGFSSSTDRRLLSLGLHNLLFCTSHIFGGKIEARYSHVE